MYYYIFQSPKNYAENKLHERIKQHLSVLGISGESTLVSPARSASELALMGIEKGYSTIVAVGGDELINEVASNIQGYGAILGVIPINASNQIIKLVGTHDFKQSCEALQNRYLKLINMATIEPNINCLTQFEVYINKPLIIQAEINDFYFTTRADKIILDHNLKLLLLKKTQKQSFFNKIFKVLNKEPNNNFNSLFYATKIRLRTHEIVPVKIGNLVVAKTPIVAYKKSDALKIIQYYSKIK